MAECLFTVPFTAIEDPTGRQKVQSIVFTLDVQPSIVFTPSAPLTEYAPHGTVIGTLSMFNGLAGQTYTYTLTDDAGGAGVVVSNELRVADSDLITSELLSVTVTATPGVGDPVVRVITIQITPLI